MEFNPTATLCEALREAIPSRPRRRLLPHALDHTGPEVILKVSAMRPILFLDLDDVICMNAPYGGYDVFAPVRPHDLWERLFHKPAVEVLLRIIDEHKPNVVLTTSWLRLMDRGGFEDMFARTGLSAVASALHPTAWEARQGSGKTRLAAIEGWLSMHHRQEPFVVIDDELSGTGLIGSPMSECGAVVLCELNVGLTADHLEKVRRALAR